jgi:type II secretory pathway pseudopilin PulG
MKNDGPQNKPSAGTGGFTLAELIIVIGIIVMLFAMLLVLYKVTNTSQTRAQNEIRRLAFAIRSYAESNGGVLPPMDFTLIDTQVVVNPQPGTDEERSSTTLFYFLTHTFRTPDAGSATDPNRPRDPSIVGLPITAKGPFLSNTDIETSMIKNPALRERKFDVVDLLEGYKGEATWFVDPWGMPYRYSRRAMDLDGNVGDEVRMKNEGKIIMKITGFVLESAGPDGKFGDPGNPSGPDARDNIKLEEGR